MIFGTWVSHQQAPLNVREGISLTKAQQAEFLQQVARCGGEAVVLSTCNRTELYLNAQTEAEAQNAWRLMLSYCARTPEEVAAYTCYASGRGAAEHLFRVSSGIESVILGEPQILGQVTSALELSQEYNALGHTLSLLFRSAIHAAKRVRTETEIAKGAMSFSSLGIRRAEHYLGSITDVPVLVIGAGEMGQSVVKALALRGVRNVTMVSRTLSRVEKLAEQWDIEVAPLSDLPDLLRQARVVFAASSAADHILTPELIEPAAQSDMVLIDLALPRDIHPAVEELQRVVVYDLETLTAQLEDSLAQRQQAVPQVEALIDTLLGHYWADHQTQAVVPTIKELRSHAEEIRRAELERIANRIPEEQAQLLEEFSQRLLNKFLHHPTVALRAQAAQENGEEYADLARQLFGLAEPQ